MRTMYQASPWKAAAMPVFTSSAFQRHTPSRLGDPSAFFAPEKFIPTRPLGAPIRMGSMNRTLILMNENDRPAYDLDLDPTLVEGVDITRPICRCKFAGNGGDHELGQSCSKPTAGGSGSAEFSGGEEGAKPQGPGIGTIVAAGAVGVGVLFLLGVL